MLHKASRIRGVAVSAPPQIGAAVADEIGVVEDFYFDDESWIVRYLSVDTGPWLTHRRVMVPPGSIEPNWSMAGLVTRLSRDRIGGSPELGATPQMSRQHEAQLLGHYGHQNYWEESPGIGSAGAELPRVHTGEEHLCRTKELTGLHLQATDGEIGHVDDFLIDENWRLRYLLVDTSNWIGGKWVVISPEALQRIDRANSKMHVAMTRDAVKNSPSYDSIDVAPGEGVRIWIM